MSKKFFVTLPDESADDLEFWAAAEGYQPGTLAGQLVMDGIRDAKSRGIIPRVDGKIRALLTRLTNKERVTDEELITIAHDTEVPLATLQRIRECFINGGREQDAPITDRV